MPSAPPIQDVFDDRKCQQGELQDAADVGSVDLLGNRQLYDRAVSSRVQLEQLALRAPIDQKVAAKHQKSSVTSYTSYTDARCEPASRWR